MNADGSGKTDCRYFCVPNPTAISPLAADWAQHPALNLGLEGIVAYVNWVNRMVLPIVFQYVEDHHEEVYKTIPDFLENDIGTIVDKAFEYVKNQDAYKEGQIELAKYQAKVAAGTWDPKNVNPTWSAASKGLREGMRSALAAESIPLELAKSA